MPILPKTGNAGVAEQDDLVFEALLEQAMLEVDTKFGRLTRLAALYDSTTNQYRYPAFNALINSTTMDVVIRSLHQRLFSEWLGLNLRQQARDLERYLEDRNGLFTSPFGVHDRDGLAALVPVGTAPHEKMLFLVDMEAWRLTKARG